MQRKALACAIKSAGTPSDEQLRLINGYALETLGADDVYVRTFVVAHNGIDRDREVIDEALLGDFAQTLPGKGLFIRHPGGWDGDSGPGEGRWFAAEVQQMSLDEARTLLREPRLQWPPDRTTASLLLADVYIVRTDDNAALLKKIDGGVVGDVSIGFRSTGRTEINNADGERVARRLHSPGEALEASLVWLGAQPGARAQKGANPDDDSEDNAVTPEQIKALQDQQKADQTRISDLEAKAAAGAAAVKTLTDLTAALGAEHKALADNPANLAELAIAGKAYRERLIDDITAAERAKGLVTGDDDAAVASHKALYANADLAVLESRAKAVAAAKGSQIKSGDHNHNQGDQGGQLPEALDFSA